MRGRGAVWSTRRWWWLVAAALCLCAPLSAQTPGAGAQAVSPSPTFEIARLEASASPEEVVSGSRDAQFERRSHDTPFIYERGRTSKWWRIRASQVVSAQAEPQLLLEGSYLARVEAWVPGRSQPTSHALYGPDRDNRYSARALVIDLPQGLPAGSAVYLRITTRAAVPIAVSLAPREQVHREDLIYVAWRSAILTALVVLVLLAVAFWAGVGDRTYLFLAISMTTSVLYLAGNGGEARGVPLLEWLLGQTPQALRVTGCLGVMASNQFMRLYLELRRHAPRVDRTLNILTVVMGVLVIGNALFDSSALANLSNLGLMLSSLTVLVAAMVTSLQGHRAARFLLVSWLPLIVTCILKALQVSGYIVGAPWFTHALAASFALSGLILTIGLSDKLLQLRRDRDLASHQASIDGLTGLLNRPAVERGLRDAITDAQASKRPMCVAFVDIDHFKAINDTYGHHVGDCCLRFISMRVRNQLRKRDLLGRYGGDELLVVMPQTSLEDGLALCERLRNAVNCRPLAVEGVLVKGSLSIGLAALHPGESAEQLLERADAALYQSKASGRDHVSGAAPFTQPTQPRTAA